MEKIDKKFLFLESKLLNSLDLHTTSTNSFLTSTTNARYTATGDLQNNNRRRAIIPTPNRPNTTSRNNVKTNVTDKSRFQFELNKIVSTKDVTDTPIEYHENEPNTLIDEVDKDERTDENIEKLDNLYQLSESNKDQTFDTFII